jgi:hypothetical protein
LNRTLLLILVIALALGLLFLGLRPDAPSGGPQERSIGLEVRGDAMTPEEISVGEGDLVTLGITADRPVEFHLHGYDLEEEVEPGEPAELSFEADLTGRFEIEDEPTQTELGTLIVEPR